MAWAGSAIWRWRDNQASTLGEQVHFALLLVYVCGSAVTVNALALKSNVKDTPWNILWSAYSYFILLHLYRHYHVTVRIEQLAQLKCFQDHGMPTGKADATA